MILKLKYLNIKIQIKIKTTQIIRDNMKVGPKMNDNAKFLVLYEKEHFNSHLDLVTLLTPEIYLSKQNTK